MSYRQALVDGERAGAAWSLLPPRSAQAVAGGAREGRRAGGSLEFRDYRDYEPGDDLRHLDWSVYARSDRLAVRRFNEEVNPFVDIVIDGSRSMAVEPRKAEVTLALAAFFATAARNAGFPYAVSMADRRFAGVPSSWPELAFDAEVEPIPPLRPKSMRILLSDLLWPDEPRRVVHKLAGDAASAMIVEVFAAADEHPAPGGDMRLVDVETSSTQDLVLDAAALVAYRDALLRHRASWDAAARESRALLLRCVAEEVGEGLVFDALAAAQVLAPC
jgi:uncharacterized protein (DUF58 family)